MIFQNGFGSSKEVASPREPEPKPFLEKPEPCQRGPYLKINIEITIYEGYYLTL
jgi:hypothetical protein